MTRNRRNRWVGAAAVTAALFLGTTAAWAHHEIAAKFDLNKAVRPDGGRNVRGLAKSACSRLHQRQNRQRTLELGGRTGKSHASGDGRLEQQYAASGRRDHGEGPPGTRQLAPGMGGDQVRFTETGLPVFPAKLHPSRAAFGFAAGAALARWPSSSGGLTPGTAEGYWTDPSKTALVEDGVDVKMDEWGLLANLADAGKVAPMQPWALGLYRHRQERQLRDDPMYLNCKPPGGARQYQSRLGVEFMEDRAHERIFVLMGSGNHNYRIIYMDRKRTGRLGHRR